MNNLPIQYIALVVCVFAALLRLPGAVRGQGRTVFFSLVLLAAAVGLSLDIFYDAVDGALGGVNLANLLVRFSLYAVFALLGLRMADAFSSSLVRRLIVGPFGIAILVITVSATLYFFVASELQGSSAGLRAFEVQSTVQQYATVGRLYPAYIAACLVVPGLSAVLDGGARTLHRIASGSLTAGFSVVVVYVVLRLMLMDLQQWDIILPFSAVLLTVLGLCLIWLSHTVNRRNRKSSNKLV